MADLLTTTITGGVIQETGTTPTIADTSTIVISTGVVIKPHADRPTIFESTNSVTFASSAYDLSTNKYVVAYRDDTDGGKGKAIVGTPSGGTNSIVWGSPVQFSTGETTATSGGNIPTIGYCMQYDPDTERILIAWSEGDSAASPGKGTSKVGAVSGTGASGTITFGAEGIFDTGNKGLMSDKERFAHQMAYDTNQNKMVLTWSPMISGKGGVASVGTIVGGVTNSITWGTPVDVEPVVAGTGGTSGEFSFVSIIYDTASQNIVIAWEGQRLTTPPSFTTASFIRVGTVSGTSITFGTKIEHMSDDADDSSLGYDPVTQKIILLYTDYGSFHGYRVGEARVGTVSGSGTTATCFLGEPTTFSKGNDGVIYACKANDIVYNTTAQRHYINYMTFAAGAPAATFEYLLAKTAKVTSLTLSCTTTNASTTVTTADTSSLVVGMSINGTGMGVGAYTTTVTRIESITNSTTFVLDTAASASGTSSLGFTSISFSDQAIIETSGLYQNAINDFDMNVVYNSTDNKILVPRSTPRIVNIPIGRGPSAAIVSMNTSAITIDLATGGIFTLDLQNTAGIGITSFTVSNVDQTTDTAQSFILKIIQGNQGTGNPTDYPARQIIWSELTNIKWPSDEGPNIPTLTATDNAVDILSFTTYDKGVTWHGSVVGQNFI